MFRTLFGRSQVRCEVQKFIMKFKSKFVNKASNWLLEQEQPIKCSVHKLVCESHYELLNFTTNLRISERSSEHLREKLAEIDCKTLVTNWYKTKKTYILKLQSVLKLNMFAVLKELKELFFNNIAVLKCIRVFKNLFSTNLRSVITA